MKNTAIRKVYCYIKDSNNTAVPFDLLDPDYKSNVEVIESDDVALLGDFSKTIANYSVTEDVWILTINDTITYPESLLDAYMPALMSPEKKVHGLFGYMLDTSVINNNSKLVHVLDLLLSACYHRSFFTERWPSYCKAIHSIPPNKVHTDIVLANWFSMCKIQLSTIEDPVCTFTNIIALNPSYVSIDNSIFVSSITTLNQYKMCFIKIKKESTPPTVPTNESITKLIKYYTTKRPVSKYEHIALLLENRFDPSYELVIRQAIRFIPANFRIIIMVTADVLYQWNKLIAQLSGDKLNPGLIVLPLKYTLTCVNDYNNIMLDIAFWKQFTMYKKVLLFQTDAMLFKYGLEYYMKYDYIGSPWVLTNKLINGVGNGGFSLRTIQAMITCLEKKNKNITMNEDVYYSFVMSQQKYFVAPRNIASYFANEACTFHENIIGCHKLTKYNNTLYTTCLQNSIMPYKHILRTDVGTYRYGWVHIRNKLNTIFTNPKGIELYSYGDIDIQDYHTQSWVGIFHLAPVTTKLYCQEFNCLALKNNPIFLHNLTLCKGIFTLSKYTTAIWKRILTKLELDIPVDTLYYPANIYGTQFDAKVIDTIDTITMIGTQLQHPSTLFKLNAPSFRKVLFTDTSANTILEECKEYETSLTEEEKASTRILSVPQKSFVSILETDTFINNFIIVHQINASLNTTIVEAIMRNVPIFCNRFEMAEEYLGKDYPLFYKDLPELQRLLHNKPLIQSAHSYLNANEWLKTKLLIETFITDILNSHITKHILTQTVPPFLEKFNELKL